MCLSYNFYMSDRDWFCVCITFRKRYSFYNPFPKKHDLVLNQAKKFFLVTYLLFFPPLLLSDSISLCIRHLHRTLAIHANGTKKFKISPISFTLSLVHLHQKSSESAAKFQTYITSMENMLLHMPVTWKRNRSWLMEWPQKNLNWYIPLVLPIGYFLSVCMDPSVGILHKYVLANAKSHLLNLSAGVFPVLSTTDRVLAHTNCLSSRPPFPKAIVTLHIADPSLWELLHQSSHEELASKVFCANRCSIFQQTNFIRSELQPLYGNSSQTMKKQ